MRHVGLAIGLLSLGICSGSWASEFKSPWKDNTAIVLDPFQGNALDFDAIGKDPRVVAIIHKATQGLGTDTKYRTRRATAIAKDYRWGSYHLLTVGDATAQIDHYLSVAGNHGDELYALDVECLADSGACQSPSFKVSFETVETALRHFHDKMGFFPLVYANGSVRDALEAHWSTNEEFRSAPLWYARFRNDISTLFPKRQWSTYALWQFASEINCTPPASCPYTIPGVRYDMDINVYAGTQAQLRAEWPLRR